MSRRTIWDNLQPGEESILSQHLLEDFGVPFGSTPWKTGSFSRVYEIGQNILLRVTCLTRDGEAIVKNAELVHRMGGNTLPFVQHMASFRLPYSGVTILETVMAKVENIPFAEWRLYFSSPLELLTTLLEAGYSLEGQGIIHCDISHNNVLLATNGTFTFIDADDSCLPSAPSMCSKRITGTCGYRLVEFDKEDTALAQLVIGKAPQYMIDAGINPKTKRLNAVDEHKIVYMHPAARAEHNMVHALIIVAFAALTGASDSRVFLINYARGAYPNIPRSWQRLLMRVCSVNPNKRLNIVQALQLPLDDVGFEYFESKSDHSSAPKRRKSSAFA